MRLFQLAGAAFLALACVPLADTDAAPVTFVYTGGTDVPEPASLTLLVAGLVGLGLIRRRK